MKAVDEQDVTSVVNGFVAANDPKKDEAMVGGADKEDPKTKRKVSFDGDAQAATGSGNGGAGGSTATERKEEKKAKKDADKSEQIANIADYMKDADKRKIFSLRAKKAREASVKKLVDSKIYNKELAVLY